MRQTGRLTAAFGDTAVAHLLNVNGSSQSGAGTPKWRSVLQRLLTAGGACRDGFPFSVVEQAEILEDLVDCAERHFKDTGRYLQVWGELGEIYAEAKSGLCWHGTHRAGSDATIAGKLVEVKIISPEKASDQVVVKSHGDFEQLVIARLEAQAKAKP